MEFVAVSIEDSARFEQSLFKWASQFTHCANLRSNSGGDYSYPDTNSFDFLLGCGAKAVYQSSPGDSFEGLKAFRDTEKDWLLGHFSYDLKNELEDLDSAQPNRIGFPEMCFFVPLHLFKKDVTGWWYRGEADIGELLRDIYAFTPAEIPHKSLSLKPFITHNTYISCVTTLLHHIKIGDIYEANYCQDFVAEEAQINPYITFESMMQRSPVPFAAFYRVQDSYLLCASPERFLKKTGSELISQPIKGTAKRGKNNAEDLEIKQALIADPKERSENVMIVDLVRNDLSHFAAKGSVRVKELFGCYTFPQVHQLISTVTATLKRGVDGIDALKKAFPMGSMTGAPKIRAMELIEGTEHFRRGIYSGSVGYITPDGDFDFNVVIRSILYNAQTGYVSCPVGGAITYKASPEKEYEESLLKANASINLLSGL